MPRPFISCDWGTTNFRVRHVDGGEVRAEVHDEASGTAALAARGGDRAALFRAALQDGIARLGAPAELPVVVSGMASSTLGWKALPYAKVPFALDGRDVVWEEVERGVYLVSGLQTDGDVMRGEETEILGAAALLGSSLRFEAVMILPGTHSKHVDLIPGGVTGFRTFMTGELFDVLAKHSVLRHSVSPEAELDAVPFVEGVKEAARLPLSAALFRVRTRQVLGRQGAESNASYLSGLLIGAELSALRSVDTSLLLCAAPRLRGAYRTAAEALGFGGRLSVIESDRLSVLGQTVILDRLLARTGT
jgi:2-dehydro-3-deoxygalactonokinase